MLAGSCAISHKPNGPFLPGALMIGHPLGKKTASESGFCSPGFWLSFVSLLLQYLYSTYITSQFTVQKHKSVLSSLIFKLVLVLDPLILSYNRLNFIVTDYFLPVSSNWISSCRPLQFMDFLDLQGDSVQLESSCQVLRVLLCVYLFIYIFN